MVLFKQKYLYLIIIALTLFVFFGFWFFYEVNQKLKISFLDVGQGDAALIQTPYGQNILIDAGEDNRVIEALGKKLSWWDKTIDLIIITHPHDDHIGGIIPLISRYRVEQIFYTPLNYDSPSYSAFLRKIKKENIPNFFITKPQKIKLGENCFLNIIYPFENTFKNIIDNANNASIVSKLNCEEKKVLLTGDIEEEIEAELINKKIDLRSNIFKSAHHGSDTSNTLKFLEAVNPEIAVISVGENNDYGHPSRRVLKRFERLGAKIYRTDLDGTISFIIQDKKIIKQ